MATIIQSTALGCAAIDLWELTGLARRMPVLATFAGLAALSMAGIPITLGYVGKESLISALLEGGYSPGLPGGSTANMMMLVVLALGSMMTIGYAWRFWWGGFRDQEDQG